MWKCANFKANSANIHWLPSCHSPSPQLRVGKMKGKPRPLEAPYLESCCIWWMSLCSGIQCWWHHLWGRNECHPDTLFLMISWLIVTLEAILKMEAVTMKCDRNYPKIDVLSSVNNLDPSTAKQQEWTVKRLMGTVGKESWLMVLCNPGISAALQVARPQQGKAEPTYHLNGFLALNTYEFGPEGAYGLCHWKMILARVRGSWDRIIKGKKKGLASQLWK